MVQINGKEEQAAGMSVAAYLAAAGYNLKNVAVEINEEIVPKKHYEETLINEGDVMEIVNFVGGG